MQALQGVVGLAVIVLHIVVAIKFIQNGSTALGVVALLTSCICIGPLITLIFGWVKSSAFRMQPIMIAYTVGWIAVIVLAILNPVDYSQLQNQFQPPQ